MGVGTMKKVTSTFLFIFFSFISLAGYAQSFMEFIVVGKAWPEHKWGHLSLRIKDPVRDEIYDFGRYGEMWGPLNSEGEPILRVWTKANKSHLRYQKRGDPKIEVVNIPTSEAQSQAAFAYFDHLRQGAKADAVRPYLTEYKLRGPSFHVVNHNCVTVAMGAFYTAFPELEKRGPRYARGDGLYFWARAKTNNVSYNKREDRWNHLWWPQDVLDFLEAEVVSHKRGAVARY